MEEVISFEMLIRVDLSSQRIEFRTRLVPLAFVTDSVALGIVSF